MMVVNTWVGMARTAGLDAGKAGPHAFPAGMDRHAEAAAGLMPDCWRWWTRAHPTTSTD